jgi:hypothetical protein
MRKRGAFPIFLILAASFLFANCKSTSDPDYEPPQEMVIQAPR